MKKNLITLIAFLFLGNFVSAQIVNIPDANFKGALLANSAINTNSDGEIQVSEALAYSGSIHASDKNISDLTGIESFPRITALYCYNNKLNALNVTNNTALTKLRCFNNQLTTLNVASNLALTILECSNNPLTNLDVTNNIDLTSLVCSNNQLTNLDVTNNIDLTSLVCSSNQLTNLDVSKNTALTTLKTSNNQLTTLGVKNNAALTTLWCSSNPLTTLDVTNNTGLTSLVCSDNQLTILDVTNNTDLIHLSCGSNHLTSLDVTKNTALTSLDCNLNQLTTLDVNKNVALNELFCFFNQLTTLDLRNNTSLTRLLCSWNQLTTLDVTNNINLEHLVCMYNLLTTLDVTNNSALTSLSCHDNQLTALDVRNGNNVAISNSNFHISNNPNLTCVNVDDPVWSAANWTTSIDSHTSFSSKCCGNIEVYIDSVQDVSCLDSGFASVSALGGLLPYTYKWNTLPISIDSSISVVREGIYTVTVTDGNSCTRTTSALINAPNSVGFDLNSSLSSFGFRPGLTSSVDLHVFNDGCLPVTGQVAVVINGLVTYHNTSVTPDFIIGDTLFWDFSDWTYDSLGLLSKIYLTVDTSATMGDRICFEVILNPISGDIDTSNNIKTFCFDVRNSYDPNMKEVHPAGVCAENYTQKDETLTYTVHFQNTGNAVALDIYILDSLDSDLDVSTLRVLSQSHEPLITEVLDGNVAKFRFDNINLPDSNSNEKESHGYVTFEISPKIGLSDGTVINNTAGIFFDLNPPIITNTTLNTLVDVVPSPTIAIHNETTNDEFILNGQSYTEPGNYKQYFYSSDGCDSIIEINLTRTTEINEFQLSNNSVYPNPFSDYINIELTEFEDYHVKIFNLVGQEQSIKVKNSGSIQQIDGSLLERGIYIVQIFDKGTLIGKVKVLKN